MEYYTIISAVSSKKLDKWYAYAHTNDTTNADIFGSYLLAQLGRYGLDTREIMSQTDNGSEYIGNVKEKKGKSAFEKVLEAFGSHHRRIPPGAKTWESDVESFHIAPSEELEPPVPTVANLNVINGNVGYTLDTGFGPLDIRADFFMYARNKVAAGAETAMGDEIALMAKYTYKETITFGATGGYWIPGKYFGEDLEPMLGGYLWTAMSF